MKLKLRYRLKRTPKPRKDRSADRMVLADYWKECRGHPLWALLAFLCPSVGTVLVAYVPPLVVARLVDLFILRGHVSLEGTVPYIAAFAGSWLLGEALWRVGFHYLVKLEAAGMANLDRRAFALLLDQDYSYHATQPVGTVAKRAHAYSRNFERFADTLAFEVLANVVPLAFVSVVLWRYSPLLPLLLLACLGLGVALAVPVVKRRRVLVQKRHRASNRLSGRLSDSVINVLAVKSFAREQHEKDRYGEQVDEFADRFTAAANYQNLRYDTRMAPVYVASNVAGLVAAILLAPGLGLSAGAIVLVFSYYSQTTRVLWKVSSIYRGMESSVSEAAEFPKSLRSLAAEADEPTEELPPVEGSVRFEHVGFGYGDGPDVLEDFDLFIRPGESVGLVGASGGGKSTITKLLLRFLEPREGRILVDGQDISRFTPGSLRRQVAYVPQEPQLFHRSLRENIAYGKPSACDTAVEDAAQRANAAGFIRRLPEGYETQVGERGSKLSGGQRQRVAIARALLRDAPIIVLDEATSALDSESERYIQEGLLELMNNRTAIVIAHRLSTLVHLDRIVVIDDGRVVQSGTHDELLADKKGPYRKLWALQTS